jgi:hypothetical protein
VAEREREWVGMLGVAHCAEYKSIRDTSIRGTLRQMSLTFWD